MQKKKSTIFVDEDGTASHAPYTPILFKATMEQRVKNRFTSLWLSARPWVITALLMMRNTITKLIDKLY